VQRRTLFLIVWLKDSKLSFSNLDVLGLGGDYSSPNKRLCSNSGELISKFDSAMSQVLLHSAVYIILYKFITLS
jgi:hypothetical protein